LKSRLKHECHDRTRFVAHFGPTHSASHWAAKRPQMNGNQFHGAEDDQEQFGASR
jgi:hypothetical protein